MWLSYRYPFVIMRVSIDMLKVIQSYGRGIPRGYLENQGYGGYGTRRGVCRRYTPQPLFYSTFLNLTLTLTP